MLALLAASSAQFTFRSALEGEWELERTKQGAIVRARYSLRGDGPRALEGDYFEESADGGVEKSMRVRVDFSDDNAGDFQIARLAAPPPADADEAPVPEPALKTAFSFDFAPLHGGRYLLSETPRRGGIVQFMMLGRDHFVLSQYATTDGSPAVPFSLRCSASSSRIASAFALSSPSSLMPSAGTIGLPYLPRSK